MDERDLDILAALQGDGRVTNKALGDLVGLSEAACSRRVAALSSPGGPLERFAAIVRPADVGLSLRVFLLVRMDVTTGHQLSAFESAVQDVDAIRQCHRLMGDTDYLLQVLARDLADYERIFTGEIMRLPGIGRTTSLVALVEAKNEVALPRSIMQA